MQHNLAYLPSDLLLGDDLTLVQAPALYLLRSQGEMRSESVVLECICCSHASLPFEYLLPMLVPPVYIVTLQRVLALDAAVAGTAAL